MTEQKHTKRFELMYLDKFNIKDGFAIYGFNDNYTPEEFEYYIEPLMEYCRKEYPHLRIKIIYPDSPNHQKYFELYNPDGFMVARFKKAYSYILNLFK